VDPYLVLIVSDALDFAHGTKSRVDSVLEVQSLVTRVADAASSVAAIRPDVVITDRSDLETIGAIHDANHGVPVLVLLAQPEAEAQDALANGAAEVLAVAVDDDALAESLSGLANTFRVSRAGDRRQVVLAIGAHPDDVEMGVGGILAAHRAAGDDVTVLTLSIGHRPGGAERAVQEGENAAAVIGASLLRQHATEITDAIDAEIARAVAELSPTIVYTHSASDQRPEHRRVHEATKAATAAVPTVASYHGTTGSIEFSPTAFVTIDSVVESKLAMLDCFAVGEERPPYLDQSFVIATARYWSQYGVGTFCEPLELLRHSPLSPLPESRATVAL
jgi:LmbE family N-acetylglucosaminyl deacetylase